ncbi:MAG: hypothetical protein CRN43_16625, partial [Candidatus Nephrothrix sp. EaCA]
SGLRRSIRQKQYNEGEGGIPCGKKRLKIWQKILRFENNPFPLQRIMKKNNQTHHRRHYHSR